MDSLIGAGALSAARHSRHVLARVENDAARAAGAAAVKVGIHSSPAVPCRSNRNARSISTSRSSLLGTKV